MFRPEVSICIPAYNNPDGLKRALESITRQRYRDFEVVITDDSTDEKSHRIAQEFTNSIPHISYSKNIRRAGSPGNWNQATSMARGKYVKILHHDDWFTEPESLEKFVALVKDCESENVMVFSASKAINPAEKLININKPTHEAVQAFINDQEKLLLANIIGAPSATMYTNLPTLKYDTSLVWLVDVDFYIDLIRSGFQIRYTEEALIATTTDAPHQVTAEVQDSPKVEFFEYIYLYDKWFPRRKANLRGRILGLNDKYGIHKFKDAKELMLPVRERNQMYKALAINMLKCRIKWLLGR